MVNPVKTVVKCCGCIVLTQLIGILISLGMLVAFVLAFYSYAIPWGEDQIRDALNLSSDVDIGSLNASVVAANNCSGCVFGVNTEWPTNTTGALHFLDTSAGPTASAVIATSLAAGAAAGVGSMLWASFFPSAASVMSFSSGFYEMTHIVEQAQFISMISQLQIDGAPVFLYQFSREMAWTNFNVPKSITDTVKSTRRLDTSLLSATASGETGPTRYAALIGVEPKNLFFYTLLSFAIVVGAIHVLYFLGVLVFSMCSKKESFGEVAAKLYRKVIWASILALLLAQYIFSMAGSFYIYQNADSSDDRDKYFIWGTIGLAVMVGFALLFGVLIISSNKQELQDLGTYEHDQRPFSAKYSAYYDEYNFDNRFFFVPRILLAVSTGAVVGVVQDSTTQLLCILGITMVYLVLLLVREPNLLRFLYYIGITSVFMKVVLVCMMLMLVQDDYFPQSVRDNVAYGIIGVNMFIFFLLFLRQAYTIIHKLIRGCKNKNRSRSSSDDDVINLERGNEPPRNNNPPYARLESSASYNNKTQQPLNSNGTMTSNAGYANNQTNQQFARDNVGAQRTNPYDRFGNEVGATAGVVAAAAAGNGRHNQNQRDGSNEWGRYDSQPQQYQSDVQSAAAVAGAAARDRNNYGQRDYYKMSSPANDNDYRAAAAGGATTGDRFSATNASQTPYQALGGAVVGYNARSPDRAPRRKESVDVDEIDDVVVTPQANASAINARRNRQSYLAFTDSDTSSIDDDIDGRSPRSSTTVSAAGGAQRAPPMSNTSQYSDFSTDSTATDWFNHRSKTEIEDTEGTLLDAAPYGAAVGVASAFSQRDSLDSYVTDQDYDNNSMSNSLMTAGSNASDTTNPSGNFDTEPLDTGSSVLAFEDDEEEAAVEIDDKKRLSSPGLAASNPINSYDTERGFGRDSSPSFVTVQSSASSESDIDAGRVNNTAAAYLRGAGENETHEENDLGVDDDDDDDEYDEYGSYSRPDGDSFLSAMSARSDDDASFYINGQRRNTSSAATDSAKDERKKRPMKL